MSNQESIARQIDAYLHGLLSPDESAQVEQCCRDHKDWARALERGRRRLGLLQAMPPTEAAPGLVQSTLQHVQEGGRSVLVFRRRYAIVSLTVLAASVLILVGLQVLTARMKPGTLDLVLLGQRELLAATSATLRVRLVDRGSNVALAGIPVVVSLRGVDGEAQELARFTTDEHGAGSPRLDLPDWNPGSYQLEVRAATPDRPESISRTITLRRSAQLLLTSDRPVYQPGQKILLRSLVLRRPDLRPLSGRPAVFTLIDPRGNVLFRHEQPTSAYGIASAECELAQEIQEGAFTVKCAIEGTESKLPVEVRRYALPKFKLDLKADRPYYAPGGKIGVDVAADYFFGKPVAGGRLEYEVVTRTGQKIATGKGSLDAVGKTRLQVALPPVLAGTESDQGDARVIVTARVTDAAGQKFTAATETLVTSQPVRIQALVEGGRLVAEVPNRVFLLVHRADGTPLPRVRVQVATDGVDSTVQTDADGAATVQITPVGSAMRCTFRAVDANNHVLALREQNLLVGTSQADFLVRLDRASYQAGQTLRLTALGGGSEPVFVDLLRDGQAVLSEVIDLRDGQGEVQVDLPTELFGTLQLLAYRFDPTTGLPHRKSQVFHVDPPTRLRVKATLDQPEYRPGKQATLRLNLEDDQGRPTPGAISLVGVDEAVYSVLKQKPGMESTFYTLEQQLLQPVYALYSWQPGSDAGQRDLALFAATARTYDVQASRTVPTTVALPIDETGPTTLAARSLPVEQQRIEELKRSRTQLLKRGWLMLALTAILVGYVALWLWIPAEDLLKMHAIGFVACFFIGGLGFVFLGTRVDSRFGAVGSFIGSKAAPNAAAPDILIREGGGEVVYSPSGETQKAAPLRVRRHFPETLVWKPELITDDQGRLAPVQVPLADSITTWRLNASAVAADGRLGATQFPLRVFQPFFVDLDLPAVLTRNDEVGIPAVVYNYLDRPQSVTLTLTEAPWFRLDGPAKQTINLAPGEVRSTRFTVKVSQVGRHTLTVTAQANGVGDAIERTVEVEPDGKRMEFAYSGGLARPVEHTLQVPAEAIPGSVKTLVKIHPTNFSQVVEGLDSIFRLPSGCFEQTSSTTYPNVLALAYLRKHNLNLPAVEARARQYIHLGYQRLVGFEVSGGGFDWYGQAPASVSLTAYGLQQFTDMARVHDVDPRLIERTRRWLLQQRQADGSWAVEMRGAHLAGATASSDARLAITSYVAAAVFSGEQSQPEARATLTWLLRHPPAEITNPNTLALVCHALLAIQPDLPELPAYLDRLAELSQPLPDDRFRQWPQASRSRTLFYAFGPSAAIETTALAVLALHQGKRHPNIVRAALAWLVTQKDSHGTWYSTQATVQALRALLAGSTPSTQQKERRLTLALGKHREEVVLPADQWEVVKYLDLSRHLQPGENRLSLHETSDTGASYQVAFRYHVPESKIPEKPQPLDIQVEYDRTELAVGGVVKVKARVVNQLESVAPMVMLDLPIPPGFAVERQDFDGMLAARLLDRYQIQPRQVLVYLRGLAPEATLELEYTLRATMPVRVTAPAARVYEYYDPSRQRNTRPVPFVVRP
ncbi:MAG: alpha-2-macroglobulin family protein [Gemmataceae bacterium]